MTVDVSNPPFKLPPDKPKRRRSNVPVNCHNPVRKRGGRASKEKGSRFELEMVKFLQERGLAAEKVPLSGAVKGGSFEGDVTCPVRNIDRKLELKRRARAFASLDKWLGTNYALVIRDDRSRPMVVMSLDAWAELAR